MIERLPLTCGKHTTISPYLLTEVISPKQLPEVNALELHDPLCRDRTVLGGGGLDLGTGRS
jgi:hypothetical protein